jgi:hypothetical protein
MGGWQSTETEVQIRVARINSTAIERLKEFTQDVCLEGELLSLRVMQTDHLPEVVRCLVDNGAQVFSVVPQRVSL